MRDFFRTIPTNIAKLFQGRNLAYQLLAMAISYALVVSGFDWFYYESTRSAVLQSILFPAVVIGGLVAMFVPLVILLFGIARKNFQIMNTGWAVGQAALIGLGLSSFYKVFTGRIPPPHTFRGNFIGTVTDISQGFQFGFLRGGAFNGWPSSHTTTAFAIAVTLIMLYPKNKLLKYAALAYAFYIGFGVSISIHWFSDFVAGSIFGSLIGVVVGKSFWQRYSTKKQ